MFRFQLLLIIFAATWAPGASLACTGMQTYSVQFQGTYTATNQPLNFPGAANAKYSPVVLAAHKSSYVMWRTGQNASAGVLQVSMSGATTNISSELTAQMGTGSVSSFVVASGGAIMSNASVTVEITVNATHSLVSLISMIVPSTDWFVGIDSRDMCDTTTGKWKTNDVVWPLAPNDANTTGTMVISTIMCGTYFCSGSGSVNSMATVRINTKTAGTAAGCTGSSSVMATVFTNWMANSCPPLTIPSNPHFSKLVCAVHSSSYVMWKSGALATIGVSTVAQTGAPTILQQELMAAKTAGSVQSFWTASGPISTGVGNVSAMLMVNQNFPMVSCIVMIAPSPDWFLGVSSYNMCGSGNMWKAMGTSVLKAYDAGTDSGTTFTAPNNATMPWVPIHLLADSTTAGCGTNGLGTFKYVNETMTTQMPKTTSGARGIGYGGMVEVGVGVVFAMVSLVGW